MAVRAWMDPTRHPRSIAEIHMRGNNLSQLAKISAKSIYGETGESQKTRVGKTPD